MAEGAQHTLRNTYFFDKKELHYATWRPNFSSKKEELLLKVYYQVWAYFLGIPNALRTTKGLTMINSRLGKILMTESNESFKGKTIGPWVCILIEDVANLLLTCHLPRSKVGMFLEHKIVYMGRLDQCTHCKCYGHKVQDCTHPPKYEEGSLAKTHIKSSAEAEIRQDSTSKDTTALHA
jgi:hypothetical protein